MKLKDVSFENLQFKSSSQPLGTVLNIAEPLVFQTPKVIIDNIIENFLVLQIVGNESCKKFYSKIIEFEQLIKKTKVNSLFSGDTFKVKIKNTKVYVNNDIVNYNILKKGMVVICLVEISKVWVNNSNESNYYPVVKEVKVI